MEMGKRAPSSLRQLDQQSPLTPAITDSYTCNQNALTSSNSPPQPETPSRRPPPAAPSTSLPPHTRPGCHPMPISHRAPSRTPFTGGGGDARIVRPSAACPDASPRTWGAQSAAQGAPRRCCPWRRPARCSPASGPSRRTSRGRACRRPRGRGATCRLRWERCVRGGKGLGRGCGGKGRG